MANLAITSDKWQTEVIGSEQPVLVDFWAEWCGPCKAIGPSIEELASEFAGKAKVFKLDVDSEGDIAADYGIMNIPALVVFKGGKEVERIVGGRPKADIAAMINRHI